MRIFRDSIIKVDFGDRQGSVQRGVRPAVVIQNDVGNKHSPTTIVVPITSKQKKDLPTHHKLMKKNYCCLKCDSTILGEQVLTISKDQILDVIGHLREEDSKAVDEILSVSINLNSKVYKIS